MVLGKPIKLDELKKQLFTSNSEHRDSGSCKLIRLGGGNENIETE